MMDLGYTAEGRASPVRVMTGARRLRRLLSTSQVWEVVAR